MIKHIKGMLLLVTSSTMHGQFYEYGKFTVLDKQKHFVAGVVISGTSYELGLKKFEDKKKWRVCIRNEFSCRNSKRII